MNPEQQERFAEAQIRSVAIATAEFKGLPGPDRDLLHVFTAMRKYLRALEQRIDRFGKDTCPDLRANRAESCTCKLGEGGKCSRCPLPPAPDSE